MTKKKKGLDRPKVWVQGVANVTILFGKPQIMGLLQVHPQFSCRIEQCRDLICRYVKALVGVWACSGSSDGFLKSSNLISSG